MSEDLSLSLEQLAEAELSPDEPEPRPRQAPSEGGLEQCWFPGVILLEPRTLIHKFIVCDEDGEHERESTLLLDRFRFEGRNYVDVSRFVLDCGPWRTSRPLNPKLIKNGGHKSRRRNGGNAK